MPVRKKFVLWRHVARFTLSLVILFVILGIDGGSSMTGFTKVDAYAVVAIILGGWFVLQWYGKLPHLQSIIDLITAANSRGGNILILSVASIYFFSHSIRLFYLLMDYSKDGKIGQDNAFALMGLQFATSTAFGGAFGALLKTMTGENSKSRAADGLEYVPPAKPETREQK